MVGNVYKLEEESSKTIITILILKWLTCMDWGKDHIFISFIPVHSVALAANFMGTACYLLASVSLTPRTFSMIPLCSDVL